jgi:hypothetical protein
VFFLLHGSAGFSEQKLKNTVAKRAHKSGAQFRSEGSCGAVA